jgi:hypothetical protein
VSKENSLLNAFVDIGESEGKLGLFFLKNSVNITN